MAIPIFPCRFSSGDATSPPPNQTQMTLSSTSTVGSQAHILAVEYLLGGGASDQFNVGTGTGHTVMEMIRVAEEATGKKVPYVTGPRREGDAPTLVAAAGKLQTKLGWRPQYTDLRTIVEHAWRFAKTRGSAER